MSSTLTRRQALGMFAALAATGAHADSSVTFAKSQWDVIVVGAGTAGLPAALFAASRKLRVLLLEKGADIGGTLWFSGGQMSAAGTRLQKAKGIADSAQSHLKDIVRISRGTANQEIVRLAVENAAGTLDWLDASGLPIGPEYPVPATGHEPYSHARVWASPDRGIAILGVMRKQLEAAPKSLQLLTGVEALEPILDARKRVVGVVCVDSTGARRDFRAPHVVLASGGYMGNPALFKELNGLPQYRAGGWPLNTGGGVQIGRAAGGWTRGSENFLCDFGSIPASVTWPSPELARSIHHPHRRQPWEIAVNSNGRRFMAEDLPSVDDRERALVEQPEHRYWLVFDQEILNAAPVLVRTAPPGAVRDWTREEMLAAFDEQEAFVRAGSLEELAAKTGMDGATLAATVRSYNEGRAKHHDAFGRKHMPRPIERPPYYAIRHQGGTLISIAGLAVDARLRVTRPDGSPIPGLYAAGELLGNGTLSGKAFCAGMMVTPALTFGRWLGQNIR